VPTHPPERFPAVGFGTIESERRSVIVAVQYDTSGIIFQRFKIKVESTDQGL
jgi:hypothetical protein